MRRAISAVALAVVAACATPPQQSTAPEEASPETDYEIVFEGNDSFPGFRLERVVEDLLIDFGRDPTNEAAIYDAAADLTDHYLANGFPDTEVEYRIEPDPELRVVFTVVEGPRVTVSSLELEGNTEFETEELLELWSRTQSGVLGTGDPYYVEGDLLLFGLAIRSRYSDRGYLDVDVSDPEVERSADGYTVAVRLEIDEGVRYTLSTLLVSDALSEYAEELDRSAVGQPYDPLETRNLRVHMREILRNSGYPDPVVEMRLEVDDQSKTVTASLSGSAGTRAKVGEIVITGQERTLVGVIRQRIAFREGEWYDGSKVEETLQDLYLSGLFRKVEVKAEESSPGSLRMTVRVEEGDAREVSFLAGYGSYELARGGVFFTDRNLFGLGQSLRFGGKASVKSFGTDATWSEPRLFGSNVAMSGTTFFKEREEQAYTDTSVGTGIAFSRRLFAYTQGRVGYGYRARDARDVDPSLGNIDNEFDIGSVFVEITRDSRDSQIYPRRGHRESIRYEVASTALGGELDFERLTFGVAGYLPFWDEWVFSASAQTGLIWSDAALPVQERFYNGGDATVRSFREDKLGPTTPNGAPAGGEFRTVFNAELRHPLFKALKGAVFVDAGNVGSDVHDWGLSNLRYAVGAGLRLALPIGPVRFDAAWNPDAQGAERDYALHLTVGLPF